MVASNMRSSKSTALVTTTLHLAPAVSMGINTPSDKHYASVCMVAVDPIASMRTAAAIVVSNAESGSS